MEAFGLAANICRGGVVGGIQTVPIPIFIDSKYQNLYYALKSRMRKCIEANEAGFD